MKNITWDIEYRKVDGSSDLYADVKIVNTFTNSNRTVGMVGIPNSETEHKPRFRRFLYEGVIEMKIH